VSVDAKKKKGCKYRVAALVTLLWPPRCQEKVELPVSMTKLLSHGYVADKKKKSHDDDDDASSTTTSRTDESAAPWFWFDSSDADVCVSLPGVTSEQTSTVMTEDVEELE